MDAVTIKLEGNDATEFKDALEALDRYFEEKGQPTPTVEEFVVALVLGTDFSPIDVADYIQLVRARK